MKKKTKVETLSPDETFSLGKHIAALLPKNSTVAFFGDLGAGKTTLIKSIASELAQIDPSQITSPTFSYLHIYSGAKTVYHFDLYRIKSAQEFVFMGFDDYLGSDGICLLEWPERIEEILPANTLNIHIISLEKNKREICYEEISL